MTPEEIIEGNKLIAEFMGIKDNPNKKGYYYHPLKKDWGTIKGFKYHSSWDWLMPVVEKIEGLGYKTVLATSEWGSKYYQNIITGVGIIKETVDNPSKFMGQSDSKIEAVYKAAIEFIKWYNQTKK